MCINSSKYYEKIDFRRKGKHLPNSTTPSSTPSSLKLPSPSPDNLSFIDIHITKHFNPFIKHSPKTDISFRNDKPPPKPNQKVTIELNNNNTNNKLPNRHNNHKEQTTTFRTITHSNSPLKNSNVNISNIRKAFLNFNKRNCGCNNHYNITPIKRRVKSPQVIDVKDKGIKTSLIVHNCYRGRKSNKSGGCNKKNFHSNNSSCSKRNERIIISTLPRAVIDISNSDPVSQGLNFTYNNDEVVNIFLKLKSKNTKINSEMAKELKLLKDEIDEFIQKYNS